MEREFITLDNQNIDNEHICCAFSDKKCSEGYLAKKEWLKNRIKEGYTFKKLNVKHKVFIEYGLAEKSWMPVNAPNYMLINCFWVAGSFKGSGLGKQLLEECIKDSVNCNGIVVLCSDKKKPFLSDKKFFTKQGFEIADTAQPYFELLYLKESDEAPIPKFLDSARKGKCGNTSGLTVYYSNACPYTEYYVNDELKGLAGEKAVPIQINKITSREQARKLPVPFSIYSVFYNGHFITHEILSRKRFEKVITPLLT